MSDIPPGLASIVVAAIGAAAVAWASAFAARRTSQRERQQTLGEKLAACEGEVARLTRREVLLLERLARIEE